MGFPRQEYCSECHFLLQEIFPTQESSLCLLHCQTGSLPLGLLGSPNFVNVANFVSVFSKSLREPWPSHVILDILFPLKWALVSLYVEPDSEWRLLQFLQPWQWKSHSWCHSRAFYTREQLGFQLPCLSDSCSFLPELCQRGKLKKKKKKKNPTSVFTPWLGTHSSNIFHTWPEEHFITSKRIRPLLPGLLCNLLIRQ